MKVGVRELRQNLSVYLERVSLGETLQITDRGRPVALLTPLTGAASRLDSLVAAGRAREPINDLLDIDPIELERSAKHAAPASDALIADREERLG
jgi:prevent-host-death family protein